jgi:hypothetical protein
VIPKQTQPLALPPSPLIEPVDTAACSSSGLLWEVSPTGGKGVDPPVSTLFGMELAVLGGKVNLRLTRILSRLCIFSKGRKTLLCTPLCSYSPAAVGKSGHLRSKYLDWVVQRAKESHRVVGVSCEGYEEHFMAFGQ